MSENKMSANGKGKPAREAVIRRLEAAEETAQERIIKKHIPAWVISGAFHIVFMAFLVIVLVLFGRQRSTDASDKVIVTTADKPPAEEEEKNLIEEEPGLDPNIEAALPEIQNVDKQTVDAAVTNDVLGTPEVANNNNVSLPTPGVFSSDPLSGAIGEQGPIAMGSGGQAGTISASFEGRGGATKSQLLAVGGGSKQSELAVAGGLSWLASVQLKDGGWEYDLPNLEERKKHRFAATGMALLPFLAAGETHKASKNTSQESKYRAVVERGLDYLKRACPTTGPNAGRISTNMYEQGIAALPLCEAYGMTKDPLLKPFAQAAINYIQRAQGPNGSWGYSSGQDGDTSIVGWQVQALKAAQLSKDLVVSDAVIKKAVKFLELAAAGPKKAMYGYRDNKDAQPSTARTAVGLLSRYYIDGWGPNNPGMIEGVSGLMKKPPLYMGAAKDTKPPGLRDMYYYYYATQVVHFYEGEDWKTWNEGPKDSTGVRKGGMRDWLIATQISKEGPNRGSWDPETGWFGTNCGRVGTTAMVLLTLEVYYRHLPLYKRDNPGGEK